MLDIATEAFFLPASRGARFCILRRPVRVPRGAVLYVHPFAEEMNKSRRAVAVAARALARTGWVVLQVDLSGCGDSEGELGKVTWADWVDDVACAGAWVAERFDGVAWLWGLRAGCLVASDALSRVTPTNGIMLWQPVLSGNQHLSQFLRLKVASEALANTAERATTRALREQIARGKAVEVAGYTVCSGIADGLERTELRLEPAGRRVVWLEISSADEPTLTPAAQARLSRFAEQGVIVESAAVAGEAFWQTAEIAECPALVARTVEAMNR